VLVKRVEKSDNQIDYDGKIEEDVTPKTHVTAHPKQGRLTCKRIQFLLFIIVLPFKYSIA